MSTSGDREAERIRNAYGRRTRTYEATDPAVLLPRQELERRLARLLRQRSPVPVAECGLLEVGCGAGGNLLSLLRLGFQPEHLVGNELLPDRLRAARRVLPAQLELVAGDGAEAALGNRRFHLVLAAVVFSSILDDGVQERLARRMWDLVLPGGAVVWYDFVYDNPRNPDVRGVNLQRVRHLFPGASCHSQRVTLAPPLARAVTRVHPGLYGPCNWLPLLRTHLLCWLGKPAEQGPPS